MLRRTFLQSTSTAALAAAGPGDGIRLGFDTYSIRAFQWKAIALLDYADRLRLDTVQLSSLGDYESLDPAYLAKVKDHAARLGLTIDAGMGCICSSTQSYNPRDGDPVENILKGLRAAQAVGSRMMRCYMGSQADRHGPAPLEAHMENTIKLFRAVRAQALDMGVKIALENHAGDMQAREVRTIIEESGKDAVGSCLDTGNPMWVAEDPFVSLEILGPYVVTTHIRDSVVYEHPRGAAAQWVALGDGSIDFKRFVDQFQRTCPHSNMQLEIITGRAPTVLPYLEPDFWKAFSKTPAWEFARFVALAKSGHPFMGSMLIPGPGKQPAAIDAAVKEQQRIDLERSFEYAKKVLGVGVRWKTSA